jgi:hypothetical protein
MGGSSVRVGPWVAERDERKAMRAASQDEKKSTWEAAAFFWLNGVGGMRKKLMLGEKKNPRGRMWDGGSAR